MMGEGEAAALLCWKGWKGRQGSGPLIPLLSIPLLGWLRWQEPLVCFCISGRHYYGRALALVIAISSALLLHFWKWVSITFPSSSISSLLSTISEAKCCSDSEELGNLTHWSYYSLLHSPHIKTGFCVGTDLWGKAQSTKSEAFALVFSLPICLLKSSGEEVGRKSHIVLKNTQKKDTSVLEVLLRILGVLDSVPSSDKSFRQAIQFLCALE